MITESGSGSFGTLAKTYIRLLIQHEKALAAMYQLFASHYPSSKNFWDGISKEELAHADVLAQLQKMCESGQAVFKRADFDVNTIYESLDYLNVIMETTKNGRLDESESFEFAIKAENMMIEKHFFHVVKDDSREIQMEFAALEKHTGEHIAQIRRAYAGFMKPHS
jgi:hypothetical protein